MGRDVDTLHRLRSSASRRACELRNHANKTVKKFRTWTIRPAAYLTTWPDTVWIRFSVGTALKVVVEACPGPRITCCATSALIQPATQKGLREDPSAGVQWRAKRLAKCSPRRRSAFLRRCLLPLGLLSKAKRPRIRLGVRMRGLYAVCRYVCGTRGMREKANSKEQISEHSPSMCDYAATVDTFSVTKSSYLAQITQVLCRHIRHCWRCACAQIANVPKRRGRGLAELPQNKHETALLWRGLIARQMRRVGRRLFGETSGLCGTGEHWESWGRSWGKS